MSLGLSSSKMTMEGGRSFGGAKERLGLSFTIDYLLFNKGFKSSKEEKTGSPTAAQTVNSTAEHQASKLEEVGTHTEEHEKRLQGSYNEYKELQVKEGEGDGDQRQQREEEENNTTFDGGIPEKSQDKPTQSYIALIAMAILASEKKKLLLCDIYQWIMDHYPYFKSKDKNWRNSVRHNLSLNECFIKAGRSDNGKGHFWAIHPSNYQDFTNGDYHCRRARRRVRRVTGQPPFAPLGSPYYPALHRPPRGAPCWCCPAPPHVEPLSCLPPRLFWGWPGEQARIGLHSVVHVPLHHNVQ